MRQWYGCQYNFEGYTLIRYPHQEKLWESLLEIMKMHENT